MRPLVVLAMVCAVAGCGMARANMATVRLGVPPKDAPGVRKGPDVPTGYVVPTKAAPKIDGKVDEDAWKQAAVLSLGTMTGRGKAKLTTQVYALHDSQYLYVA